MSAERDSGLMYSHALDCSKSDNRERMLKDLQCSKLKKGCEVTRL